MPTVEILKTYTVTELKKEVGKARMKGYSKLKKAEVVALMMKSKDKFHHLKGKTKAVAKPKTVAKPKAKPAKKEPAHLPKNVMDNIKGFMNVGKDAKKRGLDVDKIIRGLDEETREGKGYHKMRSFFFYLPRWLDKRKPTTEKAKLAQKERAKKKMMKALKKSIDWTLTKHKWENDEDVVKYWLYYANRFGDTLIRTPKELAKMKLPDDR